MIRYWKILLPAASEARRHQEAMRHPRGPSKMLKVYAGNFLIEGGGSRAWAYVRN